MKPVVMQGVKTHPGMMATVYWDQNSKDVYMVVNNLPAPPSGKQYQLWAIIDGKPVSAGLYDMTDPSKMVQKMKNIQGNVQTFAITLEQKGGSSTPTLDQMYVAGNV
jgi:anti-sigma-K factor RskA